MRYVGTGAGRGIGREVARLLRVDGHPVAGLLRLPVDGVVTGLTLRPWPRGVSA